MNMGKVALEDGMMMVQFMKVYLLSFAALFFGCLGNKSGQG